MPTPREEKEQALIASGHFVAGKIQDMPDWVLDAAQQAVDRKAIAASLPDLCPIGTRYTFIEDGRSGRVTGYNRTKAVFEMEEPEIRELDIDDLKIRNIIPK